MILQKLIFNFCSGQMLLINNGNSMLFMSSLHVTTVRELVERNIFIGDIQMHDATRDLIMLNQSRFCQVSIK